MCQLEKDKTPSSRAKWRETTRSYGRVDGPKFLERKLASTVFSQKWALVLLDEAHNIRTEGNLLKATIALRLRAESLVMLTATPLFNAERVISNYMRFRKTLLIPCLSGSRLPWYCLRRQRSECTHRARKPAEVRAEEAEEGTIFAA